MQYHIKLKNIISYTGVVKATREEPDVYTEDESVMAAALRTGYFDLVETLDTPTPADADTIPLTAAGEQADDGSTPAHFDRAYLETLSFAELKRLASSLDVPVTKTTKKADLITAIADETVTVPTGSEDEAEPDFGEE